MRERQIFSTTFFSKRQIFLLSFMIDFHYIGLRYFTSGF